MDSPKAHRAMGQKFGRLDSELTEHQTLERLPRHEAPIQGHSTYHGAVPYEILGTEVRGSALTWWVSGFVAAAAFCTAGLGYKDCFEGFFFV